MPVLISSALAVGTFVFYVGVSSALQSFYYSRRPTEVALWKSQPNKVESLRESGKDKWWWPATELLVPHAQRKPGRHPMHPVFATVNTLLASLYMFVAAELTANGYSRIQWSWDEFSIASFVTSVVLACLWENVVEYYHHVRPGALLFFSGIDPPSGHTNCSASCTPGFSTQPCTSTTTITRRRSPLTT